MKQFTTLTSRAVVLPEENIDTDQIIPARFLKITDKAGLGAKLFSDWRYLADGSPNPDFVLNRPESQDASILVAGDNFGCGSSREHAPWALMGYGFRAVISTSFADIFRNNSLKNGLLPVVVSADFLAMLLQKLQDDPQVALTLDLAGQTLQAPGAAPVQFPVDGFSKTCLLNGTDEMGYLLALEKEISAYEKNQPVV